MKRGSTVIDSQSGFDQSIKKVIALQVIAAFLVILMVTVYSYWSTVDYLSWQDKVRASLFGSALALINTILSARSMRRCGARVWGANNTDQPLSMAPIFSGLVNKLVIVGGGIGFGLIIGLDPIFVVITYLLVQLVVSVRLIMRDT